MADVSRETGATSDEAAKAFPSERLPLARRYADLLSTDGVARGLIGPREAPRLWERHLINCALLQEAVPQAATLADLGSGAGLPGVVLAIARPDLRVTLVEPLQRRAAFLAEVVTVLGLTGAEVVRDRAEGLHGSRIFDVVTARAVAPLERLLGWAMPLVAPAGVLLAMKGDNAATEVASAASALRRLDCDRPEIVVLGDPASSSTATVVRVAHRSRARVS